jgi:hypothetical protein
MDLHKDVTAAWDIFMPASIPVVDTLTKATTLATTGQLRYISIYIL